MIKCTWLGSAKISDCISSAVLNALITCHQLSSARFRIRVICALVIPPPWPLPHSVSKADRACAALREVPLGTENPSISCATLRSTLVCLCAKREIWLLPAAPSLTDPSATSPHATSTAEASSPRATEGCGERFVNHRARRSETCIEQRHDQKIGGSVPPEKTTRDMPYNLPSPTNPYQTHNLQNPLSVHKQFPECTQNDDKSSSNTTQRFACLGLQWNMQLWALKPSLTLRAPRC